MVVGDKIRLVKPFGVLDNVGEVYNVVAIFKAGEIYFEYGNGYTGVMSYDDFEKHFELVSVENKVEKKKHEWSEWKDITTLFWHPLDMCEKEITIEWRTDHEKRTQVRTKSEPHLRARSSCYKNDKYSEWHGFALAKCRLYVKMTQKIIDDYAKSL